MVHEKTTCPRCQRRIDAFARVCPFCNFENRVDRDDAPAKIPLPQTEPPAVRSQPDASLRERLLGHPVILGLGIALMLVSAFAVGALVNLLGSRGRIARAEEDKPAAATTTQQERDPLANLTLVPVTSAPAGTGVVTSAPMPSINAAMPVEAQRADATALPSSEYSKVLAQSARVPDLTSSSVDPRTLPPGLGGLQQQSPPMPARAPEPQAESEEVASETEASGDPAGADRDGPVPVKQPIPRLENLEQSGVVRLRLTVNAEGRVTGIAVVQGLRGATAEMVEAARKWRFKPATRNGEAVQGTFDAEIFFNGQR